MYIYISVNVYAYIIEDTLPEVCGYVKHSSISIFSGWLFQWAFDCAIITAVEHLYHDEYSATGNWHFFSRIIFLIKALKNSTFLHEIIWEFDRTWGHNYTVDGSEIRPSQPKGMYCKTWTWNPDIHYPTHNWLSSVVRKQQDVFYCNASISLHFLTKKPRCSGARCQIVSKITDPQIIWMMGYEVMKPWRDTIGLDEIQQDISSPQQVVDSGEFRNSKI